MSEGVRSWSWRLSLLGGGVGVGGGLVDVVVVEGVVAEEER